MLAIDGRAFFAFFLASKPFLAASIAAMPTGIKLTRLGQHHFLPKLANKQTKRME